MNAQQFKFCQYVAFNSIALLAFFCLLFKDSPYAVAPLLAIFIYSVVNHRFISILKELNVSPFTYTSDRFVKVITVAFTLIAVAACMYAGIVMRINISGHPLIFFAVIAPAMLPALAKSGIEIYRRLG